MSGFPDRRLRNSITLNEKTSPDYLYEINSTLELASSGSREDESVGQKVCAKDKRGQ